MQADKTVKKYKKELEKLSDSKCPACEQDLQDHKHQEMQATAQKNLSDAHVYLQSVSENYANITQELDAIGDINGRPQTGIQINAVRRGGGIGTGGNLPAHIFQGDACGWHGGSCRVEHLNLQAAVHHLTKRCGTEQHTCNSSHFWTDDPLNRSLE